MIKKKEFCLYCGNNLESKTAKKIFCNDKCRIYYNREKARGTLNLDIIIDNGKVKAIESKKQFVMDNTAVKKRAEQLKGIPKSVIEEEKISEQPKDNFNEFMLEIDASTSVKEVETIAHNINKCLFISSQEKKTLINVAKEKSKEFYND